MKSLRDYLSRYLRGGLYEASLRSLPARFYRSPDEQVRRLAAARRKRTRKCEARLWWQACGGERTLAERAAAG
jgi:hypothetical protein